MTQFIERIEQRSSSAPIMRPFTEGSAPAEVVPTNGNGKDYIYTSRSGEILHLARKKGQELPSITWIPAEDASRSGEFFIQVGKNKRAEVIETTHQVRIELAGERDEDTYKVMPEVTLTPQKGESIVFKIGQNKRGQQYVEIEQAYAIQVKGTLDNKANVAVSETGQVIFAQLNGDTNIITTYGTPHTDIHPHGIAIVKASNTRNKINGYTVDELGEFTSAEFSTFTLTQLHYGRYDDFREGRESVGRPARPDLSALSGNDQSTGDISQEVEATDPKSVEESEREAAIRRFKTYIQRQEALKPQFEQLPTRGELRRRRKEEQRQAELAAERAVTEYVNLGDKPLRQEIKDMYDKTLWVQNSEYDVKLAEILSLVATHSDKKRPLMMTSVLRPDALRFLRNNDDRDLQEMTGSLMMNAEDKSVFEIVWKKTELGLQILAAIETGLEAAQKVRLEREGAAPKRRRFSLFQ